MKPCFVAALLVLVSLPAPSPAQQPLLLTDGTPVRIRLNRNVSSADAKVGDPVDFDVVEDVLVNGAIVIQRNSRVMATVTEAEPKGWMGKSGKLDISVDHARSILGDKIALRAVRDNDPGGNGKTSVTSLARSIVTAPLFLFMRGKDITVPKGTEVITYVHGDVRLDEARIRAQPVNSSATAHAATPRTPAANESPAAAAPVQTAPAATAAQTAPAAAAPQAPATPAASAPKPAPPSGITNSDILNLKAAGFSDELIISKIKSSRCAFRLETNDLIALKEAGLSERVIAVMMEKMQ